ncbi:site-specific integrase [Aliiroseovarius crassostreae]|uniref:Site-specific integrase n=1 Tax=Aliiroseovarius crassostreae TaxID=154981 RepID=A0A9Q9LWG2_9RHOB|nr:site-specific integrase [Aliiroseovarius crassostreae]
MSKTFTRLTTAKKWRNRKLLEIEEHGFPLYVVDKTTISDVINDRLRRGAELARTAEHTLKFIANHEFGQTKVGTLTQQQLYDFADHLSSEERSPQTVAGYMSHLARTLNWANDRGTVIPVEAVTIAMRTMWEDEVLARSEQRNRRPEIWELDRILTAIFENKRQKIPVGHLLVFAIFSARRISEICRLRWEDLNEEEGMILVREMKHPRQKKRNNVWCELPPEAMAIIRVMPRISEFIFPFDPRSVGAAFRRHRDKVGVVDLRFHDLRHEAISRLSEMGTQAEFVAKVSGHKGASCLERYTHVKKVGDKYQGWSWLDFICAPKNLPENSVLKSIIRRSAC